MKNIFEGRLNRLPYFIYSAVLSLLLGISVSVRQTVPETASSALAGWFILLIVLVLSVLAISIIIRRFHDTGKSGYYFFTLLIPFVNLYFSLYLLLKPGDNQPNAYGLPRVQAKPHYVLGILVVLLALLPIIALIAYISFWPSVAPTPLPPATTSPGVDAIPSINTVDWQTYTNQQYGFQLSYPQDKWVLDDQPDVMGMVLILYSRADLGRTDNKLTILVQDSLPDSSHLGAQGTFAGRPAFIDEWKSLGGMELKHITFQNAPFLSINAVLTDSSKKSVIEQVFNSFTFVGN